MTRKTLTKPIRRGAFSVASKDASPPRTPLLSRPNAYLCSRLVSTACAHQTHIGMGLSVPRSVPKRGPAPIIRQPTPTKFPIKNGPEIVNFRAVLRFLAALAKPRLRPFGHLTDPVSVRASELGLTQALNGNRAHPSGVKDLTN